METAAADRGARDDRLNDLATILDRARAAIGRYIAEDSPLLSRLDGLRERLRRNRLQLAVLGQFKRGKSTFINALLGVPLLPIGVVPLTAVPTFISWRARPLATVRFSGERPLEQIAADDPHAIREFLFRFVAEEANPENRLGVERVDLFYPAAILADGTVLIDTPGVGSTLQHNTEAALRVLPQCDADLFIASADPPITGTEVDYLRRLRSKAARILFVLNKIDYLSAEERKSVVDFLHKVLDESVVRRSEAEIFSVSARDGLEAKRKDDRDGLEQSGMAALETNLVRELATGKGRMLEAAIRSKAQNILTEAAGEVGLRISVLRVPLTELSEKSQAFEDALRAIEEQRRVTRDLLASDRRRLREELEARTGALRRQTWTELPKVIDRATAERPGVWDEAAQTALSAAVEATFDTAQRDFTSSFSANTDAALAGHRRRIDELTDSVRRTAAELFHVPFRQVVAPESFHLGEDPYWVTEEIKATLIPDASRLIDRLLPKAVGATRRRTRIVGQMQQLVVRNAENLRWAILRGMDDTFRIAGARLDERLDDAIKATRSVIAEVLTRRKERSATIEPEVDRLGQAVVQFSTLAEDLSAVATGHSR